MRSGRRSWIIFCETKENSRGGYMDIFKNCPVPENIQGYENHVLQYMLRALYRSRSIELTCHTTPICLILTQFCKRCSTCRYLILLLSQRRLQLFEQVIPLGAKLHHVMSKMVQRRMPNYFPWKPSLGNRLGDLLCMSYPRKAHRYVI